MPAKRLSTRSRSIMFFNALLLGSAFVVPAFGQIETVIVTAQKRSEDIQSVPIAVTAYTSEDLAQHQITQFKDLQFSTPNVSYTKGNFTGSDFQIRGIGLAAVAGDAESGVAVSEDGVYLLDPPLAEATFYDLDRIEVLRGPQSTLYGRGATGGTVNIITSRPDLEEFAADGEASYGNYNASEVKGMVNIPIITDQLGLRIAGDWVRHDGYVTNIANGDDINGEDTYSVRGSLRWQPSSKTTIDVVGSYSHESDSRMRGQKQLCTFDPTGTLGCLPDSLGNDAINPNSTLSTIFSSIQGLNTVFAGGPLAGIGNALGLIDLTQQAALHENPADLRTVSTDFDPTYKAKEDFFAATWKQNLESWLDATFVGGYEDHSTYSQESYNNSVSSPLDQTRLAIAEGTLLGTLAAVGGPAYAAHFAPYFTAVPGELPVSGTSNLGIISNNIAFYTPNNSAYDQSDGYSKQYSAELRFNSDFKGPLNFMVAGYYLRTEAYGDYFVNAATLDYPGIVVGSLGGLGNPLCGATGCILGPSFYHNVGQNIDLSSRAAFGELYYDIVPDTLKLTLGLRYTDDFKSEQDRIELYSGMIPIGTSNEQLAMQNLVAQGQVDFDSVAPGPNLFQDESGRFDKFTGRAVLDWTPKLDFTDASLFYASASRGYKAGGFNPGVEPGLTVPPSYKPEGIDALEVGTKNTLLDGTLQANLAAFYYNYEDLQVSSILGNTSVNENVGARIWGVEGEFLWVPSDNWQFNLNFGHTDSAVGDFALVDPRNPTAGAANTVLIKDATFGASVGQNCVLYMIGGQTLSPADNPAFQAAVPGLFFAPPGGTHALAAHGVANTNYGTCSTAIPDAVLNAFGYSRSDPENAEAGADGNPTNLHGNQVQNTPPWQISVGAQYTFHVWGGYTLVPRADFFWQDSMWGRIFEDPSDRIGGYEITNLQLTLNSPDSRWYVQGFVKNLFNANGITGEYLTSSTSGLYTNAFLQDPRLFGIRAGVHF